MNLHDAIKLNDIAQVTHLIQNGGDIEETTRYHGTALILASHEGHTDLIRLLVAHGANLHATDQEGKTALHHAAMRGRTEAVKFLIELGLDVNAVAIFDNVTPLHLAAAHADRKGVVEVCRVLLDAGADVNARRKGGSTALFSAGFCRIDGLLALLLDHGAEVDIRNSTGKTILIMLATLGIDFCLDDRLLTTDPEKWLQAAGIEERLLAAGSDINAQDDAGCTALMYAALNARKRVLTVLLDHGADINLQDLDGKTALMHAAGAAPAASFIGLINKEPKRPITAKHATQLAASYQHRADCVRLLLARGAATDLRNNANRTALDIARAVGEENSAVIAALTHPYPIFPIEKNE